MTPTGQRHHSTAENAKNAALNRLAPGSDFAVLKSGDEYAWVAPAGVAVHRTGLGLLRGIQIVEIVGN